MKLWLIVAASAALVIEGCQTRKATPSTTPRDSSGASATAATVQDTTRRSTTAPLLARGDTFDLRVATGVVLGSPEALSKPCGARPSVSEFLYILDTTNYAVSRVQYDCTKEGTRTVGYQSTYHLVGDTVQFFEGDGNETYVGSRAVVTRDSLITIGGSPQDRSRYVRRKSGTR